MPGSTLKIPTDSVRGGQCTRECFQSPSDPPSSRAESGDSQTLPSPNPRDLVQRASADPAGPGRASHPGFVTSFWVMPALGVTVGEAEVPRGEAQSFHAGHDCPLTKGSTTSASPSSSDWGVRHCVAPNSPVLGPLRARGWTLRQPRPTLAGTGTRLNTLVLGPCRFHRL